MVKPNLWIDRKPSPATAVANQQASYGSGSQAGTWATGRVLEVLDDGLVRVELPADEPVSEVVAPADGGVTAVGAECVCLQAGDGKVYQVVSPASLPEGGQARATGATGKIALEAAGTKAELDAARKEIEAAQKQLSEEVKAAKDAASTSGKQAAAALKRAIGRVTVSQTAPAKPADGDLWVATNADKQATGIKVWSGQAKAWQDYLLIAGRVLVPGSVGNVQLGDGAVTAPKITASDELWAKVGTFAKVTTQMLQAGQARITGELLADTIRLSTRIVAGDPSGDAAIMDHTGLHVLKAVGGQPTEVVTLGTSGQDFLSVTGTDGLARATVTGDGLVTAQSLSVADKITWKGRDLASALDVIPRGIVAWGTAWAWPGQGRHQVRGSDDIATLTVDLEGGRLYHCEMIWSWMPNQAKAMCEPRVSIRPVGNGAKDTVDWASRVPGAFVNQIQTDRAHFPPWSPNTSGTYKLTISLAHAYIAGGVTLDYGTQPPHVWLTDIGVAPKATLRFPDSVANSGKAQPAPRQNHRMVYPATWWKAYSNGSQDNAWSDSLPQGTYGGRTYNSLVGFRDMTGDLRGATITNMQLYCYARHWYGQTGTATIGVHGWNGIPGSFSSNGQWGEFGGWGRGEGRWVNIPKYLWPAFQNGTHRGISFQTGANSSYGYWDKNVQILVDYSK
jgi:hypothetical protein